MRLWLLMTSAIDTKVYVLTVALLPSRDYCFGVAIVPSVRGAKSPQDASTACDGCSLVVSVQSNLMGEDAPRQWLKLVIAARRLRRTFKASHHSMRLPGWFPEGRKVQEVVPATTPTLRASSS